MTDLIVEKAFHFKMNVATEDVPFLMDSAYVFLPFVCGSYNTVSVRPSARVCIYGWTSNNPSRDA
ncbi:MAG: hypothetical protein CR984_04150 [Proteobacteria bacterium]|nr:MAG: hypothetical protein CR984_04150 [Pseudomonadota bacterium]PIE66721.1 MAG: hypothetical protein CSA23_07735 [Deltaproteobacteria bacterium]